MTNLIIDAAIAFAKVPVFTVLCKWHNNYWYRQKIKLLWHKTNKSQL